MTEFEINKAVAEKVGVEDDYGTFTPLKKYSFDPCNNIKQAWEIMMRYNIGVIKNYYDDTWISVSFTGQVEHKKALVATMLCFLEL